MANYYDNQSKWSWHVTEDKALLTTDHGDHTHTLDLTNVTVGDMADNTGKVMGDAHRAASHDAKTDAAVENTGGANDGNGPDGPGGGMEM